MTNHTETPLESWKEIGTYLQRDATTARRWEKEEGLPVHRHSHKSRASVYAYPNEIDAWRAGRKVVPEPAPAKSLWKIPAFALTMLLCLIMVGNGVRPVSAQQGGETLNKRVICEGACGDNEANLSPEARWMVKTDWDTGDLAIRDMVTGQQRRLMAREGTYVNKTSKDGAGYVEAPVFSPDMKQIVYLWDNGDNRNDRVQLRVMANEIGGKWRVLVDNPENDYYEPAAWSPDGKSILVLVRKLDLTWQLAWVSASDGAIQPLVSLGWRIRGGRMRPSLSADGRYIAYASLAVNPKDPKSNEPGDVHIYVVASDGSGGTELVKTAGVNNNPVWTPDGRHVLFTSDISGGSALWSVPVRDGKAAGPSSLVRTDIGDIQAMGIRSGTYYYVQRTPELDYVSLASLPGGAPAGEGFAGMFPQWSTDGRSISFKRHHAGNADAYDLIVRSLDTGEERMYSTKVGPIAPGPARWFHDGQSLQVSVLEGGGVRAYRVGLKNGEFTPLPWAGLISPDDKTVYALHGDLRSGNVERVVAVDLGSGQERTVWTFPKPSQAGVDLSPDGRTLAIVWRDIVETTTRFARINVDGSSYREIYTVPRLDVANALWTTKDAQSVLFVQKQNSKLQIMRLPADGGEPQFTGIEMTGNGIFADISPDGARLAYSSPRKILQVWAVDNILSALK